MGQNEEMRNEEINQEKRTDGNQGNSEEVFDKKMIITAIAMIFLMAWGAISLFLVPSLYLENKNLKIEASNVSQLNELADSMEAIEKFSNYVDSIDSSKGLSANEVLTLEEEYLKFFMVEMINEEKVSVYVEEKVVKVLEDALENTADEQVKNIIEELLTTHKEILAEKTDELRELEDMYIGIENTEKTLEDLLKDGNSI